MVRFQQSLIKAETLSRYFDHKKKIKTRTCIAIITQKTTLSKRPTICNLHKTSLTCARECTNRIWKRLHRYCHSPGRFVSSARLFQQEKRSLRIPSVSLLSLCGSNLCCPVEGAPSQKELTCKEAECQSDSTLWLVFRGGWENNECIALNSEEFG